MRVRITGQYENPMGQIVYQGALLNGEGMVTFMESAIDVYENEDIVNLKEGQA